MATFNPLYNEETGWAAMDQLAPWQQALMNPGANNPGMSMPGVDTNWLTGLPSSQGPSISNPGASTGPNFDPNTFGFGPAPSGQGMGLYPGMPQGPGYTLPGGGTNRPPDTPSIASPALLANNMGMQGAGTQNVNGTNYGAYTQGNAPLNMSLFAPQGQDAAIMSGSMGGFGEMMYQAAQQNGINPNISYLQFIDDLSRKTLAARGGQGGLMPQDFVNYLQSQGGQQWIQGMRPQAAQQPEIRQTGPTTPPHAPQLTNPTYPGGRPPNQNLASPVIGTPGTMGQFSPQPEYRGVGAYLDSNGNPTQFPSVGGRGINPNGPMAQFAQGNQGQGQPGQSNYNSNYNTPLYQISDPNDPYSQVLRTSRTPTYEGQQPINTGGRQPGQPGDYPNYSQEYANWWSGSPPVQQQPQFSSDPAMNQAYMYDMYASQMGGGQPLPQVDFRAATYGGQGGGSSASTGGTSSAGTGTGFDFNTLTGQPFTGAGSTGASTPWANVSNRRSGFGGGSLFGNPYQAPTNTRGSSGGYIGRPASYGGYGGGQSQRPQGY